MNPVDEIINLKLEAKHCLVVILEEHLQVSTSLAQWFLRQYPTCTVFTASPLLNIAELTFPGNIPVWLLVFSVYRPLSKYLLVLSKVRRRLTPAQTFVLSPFEGDEYNRRILAAGADRVIFKDDLNHDLARHFIISTDNGLSEHNQIPQDR